MTRPLRILYEERSSERFASGELHKAELEALAQDLLVTLGATGVVFAQRESDQSQPLVCVVSVGRGVPAPGAEVDPDRGISGRCVREGRTQNSSDTLVDPRVDELVCQQLGIRSLAAVPLMHGSECAGLLEAFSNRPGHFDDEKVGQIELAASRIGELLGYETERLASPDTPGEPISRAADLNLVDNREPEAFSIAESESLPSDRDQEELWAKSRRPVDWPIRGIVLCGVFLAAITLIVRSRHIQPLSRQAANQPTPSSAPSPTLATPAAPTTPDRRSADASGSSVMPKPNLVERAERGDVAAQLALASEYQKGNIEPHDLVRAITWYIVAGANGNPQAKRRSVTLTRSVTPFEIGKVRYNVGRMYVEGMGVKRDYVSAFAWFELARAQGEVRAEAEENRLQSNMTAGQIAEARARARKWLKVRQKSPVTGDR